MKQQKQPPGPGMLYKKGVFRNFTKFTVKHPCQSLFFIKEETLAHVFSCEFCEISKNTYFTEHPWATASKFFTDCCYTLYVRLFKILYLSSTLTNITIPFISINFAVSWNVWFSKMFGKIHWSNVFFFFHMSFLKIKT